MITKFSSVCRIVIICAYFIHIIYNSKTYAFIVQNCRNLLPSSSLSFRIRLFAHPRISRFSILFFYHQAVKQFPTEFISITVFLYNHIFCTYVLIYIYICTFFFFRIIFITSSFLLTWPNYLK